MNKLAYRFATFVMALAIAGCSTLGLEKPQTTNDRIGVSIVTVTTIRDLSTTLLRAGRISVADKENVERQADVARAGLEVARTLPSDAATSKIAQINQVLAALNSYLLTKGQ